MKISVCLILFSVSTLWAQKPEWVDTPGIFANENFVAVGVAREKKPDKAREKSEKKATKGLETILKKKYPKKDIKTAMAHATIHATWRDDDNRITYALALLPIEKIDKEYAAQKNMDKARGSAMHAIKMLQEQTRDDDVVVVDDDEEIDQ